MRWIALVALLVVSGCGGSTDSYGGYTKAQARIQAKYGLLQLLERVQDVRAFRGYQLIGFAKGHSTTGADAWRVTFVNDPQRVQVCFNVWRNKDTGGHGRGRVEGRTCG